MNYYNNTSRSQRSSLVKYLFDFFLHNNTNNSLRLLLFGLVTAYHIYSNKIKSLLKKCIPQRQPNFIKYYILMISAIRLNRTVPALVLFTEPRKNAIYFSMLREQYSLQLCKTRYVK